MKKDFLKKLNFEIKNFDFMPYFIIFITAIVLLSPLLQNGKYIWGHDSVFHISNIMALKSTIQNGNWFFPKVYPIIANNFGYGTGLFYGPLSHGITVVLAIIFEKVHPLSILNIMKIVHFLVLSFSGIFMYHFSKKVTNNKWISIVSSIIYITFPYRLSDIYVRDAYAESFSFAFLPLIFNGLYELLYGKNELKFYLLFILGTSGLILTHTITTFYTAFFIFLYLLLNIKLLIDKNKIKKIIISLLFILSITSFYIVPLVEQKIYANINIFSASSVASSSIVTSYALNLSKLFPFEGSQSTDGIQFFILIPVIFLIIYSIFSLKKIKFKNKKIFLDFLILGIFCLFMSTKYFPWKYMPSIFLYIQFPWRILLFAIFFLSFGSIICLFNLKKDIQEFACFILIVLLIAIEIPLLNFDRVIEYSADNLNISTYGIGAVSDYFPVKAIENYDYYQNRSDNLIIISGNGSIKENVINDNYIEFETFVSDEPITIEVPLLYYYGYTANCSYPHNNSIKNKLEVKESDNGFVEVIAYDTCNVTLVFSGSKLTKISYLLSAISLMVYIIFIVKIKNGGNNEK